MLEIKSLKVSVHDKVILKDFNLNVGEDEIHVIMGPNGTGKSTICNVIMGNPDYTVEGGKLVYNGENLLKLSTNEIANLGIFLLMQNPIEIPGVTNAELLRSASLVRGNKESIFEFNKKLNKACEELNIDKSYIHHNINERMSGGEKKKNELLQLYMLRPNLILLDELDSGLDIDSLASITKTLNEYKKETKCSIIIITHHTNILEHLNVDKVHIMKDGKITLEGDSTLAYKIEKDGFNGAFKISEEEVHE